MKVLIIKRNNTIKILDENLDSLEHEYILNSINILFKKFPDNTIVDAIIDFKLIFSLDDTHPSFDIIVNNFMFLDKTKTLKHRITLFKTLTLNPQIKLTEDKYGYKNS